MRGERAQNAPLTISFFMAATSGTSAGGSSPTAWIVLFGLRDAYGEDKFPRPASEYLDVRAAPAPVLRRRS